MSGRFILLFFVSLSRLYAATFEECVSQIALLAHPANTGEVATLRVSKVVYWLGVAQRGNIDVTNVLNTALALVMTNQWAGEPEIIRFQGGFRGGREIPGRSVTNNAPIRQHARDSLLRNLLIAERHGCLDDEGLENLRKGQASTIKRGKFIGGRLSSVFVIPPDVCPELNNLLANVELSPADENPRLKGFFRSALALRLSDLGLLSNDGYKKFLQWIQPPSRRVG